MPNYNYTARDESGKLIRASIMAGSETELATKIGNLGLFLINSKISSSEKSIGPDSMSGLKAKEVLDFTIHLSTMLNAGVSLVDSLRDLAKDAATNDVRKVIEDVRHRVESGTSLREALSAHGSSFPLLYLSIVGAGESTGKLSSCLADLAGLLEWQLELRAKVKEAATYPIILFSVMILVVIILVVKVIPTFEPIFEQAGAKLPLPTQIVMGLSRAIRQYWYVFIIAIGSSIAGYKFYYSTPSGRMFVDRMKLKMPLLGTLMSKVALSRFCHTFSLALKSGVNVITALDMSGQVVNNVFLESAVKKSRDLVNVGEKISVALKSSGDFPPLVIRMIAVGEQSGSLVQTLEKVNQFYDREVPATIRRIFALFEPMMIVFMGVVVGGIALSIFLPMFQMADIMGK
ncbi:type II secretion system F family protein [bacterium]|nr:MAG: type II secretion system F family protein [bacterium]